jgi:hypothetical protein
MKGVVKGGKFRVSVYVNGQCTRDSKRLARGSLDSRRERVKQNEGMKEQ